MSTSDAVDQRRCYHCENLFNPENVAPVLIAGVQSYNGHLLTSKTSIRAVYLCSICLPNLLGANIENMVIEADEDRMKQRGPIPRMQEIADDERAILAGLKTICTGTGPCSDVNGNEDATRQLTHEAYDTQDRSTPYCYHHALRAYEFDLRRWRERQRGVR